MRNAFNPASPVPENHRLKFLPRMFGDAYFLNGESLLFNVAGRLLPDYDGGYWEYFDRPGGAVHFAAPADRQQWRVCVAGNYFDREVSTESAGIIVSLFALNAMAERAAGRGDGPGTDFLCDRYYELRAYAVTHPEHAAILAAID
jgi:hypothetical protein